TQYNRINVEKGRPNIPVIQLGAEAVEKAIEDAKIDRRKIEYAVCAMVFSGAMQGPGQLVLAESGLLGIPIQNVKNACASGTGAIYEIYNDIRAGLYDIGLAFGMEKLSTIRGALPLGFGWDHEATLGMAMTGKYAMRARRHMYLYGTKIEQLAEVCVKSRENASKNPYAMFRDRITIEDVLNSRMIADPLTLYQCCPNNDGAAAVILASEEIARECENPIKIETAILISGSYPPKPSIKGMEEYISLSKAMELAYKKAGITPKDVDVAEVHDAFSIGELLAMESSEFCKPGESGKMIEEGETRIDGSIPINPSGGLLSCGHPLGATGVRQACELVWQLRGEAGERQVKNAHIGIAETLGGGVSGMDIAAAGVLVLSNYTKW
ncbi:MAG: thiolase family protein, partial [Nitrososphaeria archaeon]